MIDTTSKVRASEHAVARELSAGQGGVVLHLESAQYFGLNAIGLLLWEQLDRERTVAELVAHVRARVPDAPDSVEADVVGFLEAALERGVVVVV